jgi:hypothetical protein
MSVTPCRLFSAAWVRGGLRVRAVDMSKTPLEMANESTKKRATPGENQAWRKRALLAASASQAPVRRLKNVYGAK